MCVFFLLAELLADFSEAICGDLHWALNFVL